MQELSNQNGIILTLDSKIATLTLNRPESFNALDYEMRDELGRVVNLIIHNPNIHSVILKGQGKHFCTGGNIKNMDPENQQSAAEGRQRMRQLLSTISALYQCEKPILAAVEGCAYGAGFSLALLADMVIASESSRFCLSFARVGLVPDCGALYTLPRLVGLQKAKELMYTAKEINAQEAKELGIVLEAVPEGTAYEKAVHLAHNFNALSPTGIALTKTALNQSLSANLNQMLELEANAQGIAFDTPYHKEAVKKFLNKESLFTWKD